MRACVTVAVIALAASCAAPSERAIERGNAAARANQLEEAREAYAEAVSRDPTARSHLLLGNALMSLGKRDEAIGQWQLGDAREALAADALERGDPSSALAWVDATRSLAGRALKARALLALGRGDDALAVLEGIDAIGETAYVKGCALLAVRRFDEARGAFDSLVRASSKSPLGPYGLARLAASQERAAGALLYLKAARAAAGPSWNPKAVERDAAFEFLSALGEYKELLRPPP